MPSLLTSKKYDFVSHALPADTFAVVSFTGREGFSSCYEFEITLAAADPEIDLGSVLQNSAVFTILRKEGDIPFHGILSQIEQLHSFNEYVFYRAVLVPRFRWLSLTHHNQIFLDKSVPQILEEVLKDGGLTGHDFELRLQGTYPTWEFVCQYGESHLNFVSRWMEREGMYYFFEQTPAGEKLIITDTSMSHTEMPE
ncbi:MAG: type VI secretion system tip protein VgrG, partial [Desulfococcaceae bacterium]|nr:type VI secretion system tip protein VgrG [Desulfococcaceae bacterium]